jgi:hypothetical protein
MKTAMTEGLTTWSREPAERGISTLEMIELSRRYVLLVLIIMA